jgi:CHAD domain-containing protein
MVNQLSPKGYRRIVMSQEILNPVESELVEAEQQDPVLKNQILKSPGLLPDDTLAEAGRKTWRFHLNVMLANEAGTRLGEDIEALHDMRVATRRMRAAFDVFGQAYKPRILKPYLKGLRATGRALGRVRDLDVFMEKANQYLDTLDESDRHNLDPLLESWRAERELARLEMLAYLDSAQYQKFIRRFSDFLDPTDTNAQRAVREARPGTLKVVQIRHLAPIMIYTHLADVRAYQEILDTAAIAQLHALRIEFKKLRYTVEFFREILGPETKGVIDDFKQMQDHLGDLNDADVAIILLQDFLREWGAQQEKIPLNQRRSSAGVMMYLTFRYSERHELIGTFPQKWEWFNRPEFFRNLALAVSVL